MKLTDIPHRRLNPLTNEWVVVSPQRATRPWQGEVSHPPAVSERDYDPSCYLCPGNDRVGGVKNSAYSGTFVFDNDFAALVPKVPDQKQLDLDEKGLIVAEAEPGICRVMCFSPQHNLTLSTMKVGEIETVVRTWMDQFRELGAMPNVRNVQIFENRGAMMGASNPHPHCQIWATASVPQQPLKELENQKTYLARHKRCLLCDYLALEEGQRVRIVAENEGFVAIVPFWATWPFELLICSRRHFASMNELSTAEIASLSRMLKQTTATYDRVFNTPFPYTMGFHQAPTDEAPHPEWHFHAHFYPPLLRSATVRKYMVGFEMLCTPQRDVTPEMAAEKLRSVVSE